MCLGGKTFPLGKTSNWYLTRYSRLSCLVIPVRLSISLFKGGGSSCSRNFPTKVCESQKALYQITWEIKSHKGAKRMPGEFLFAQSVLPKSSSFQSWRQAGIPVKLFDRRLKNHCSYSCYTRIIPQRLRTLTPYFRMWTMIRWAEHVMYKAAIQLVQRQ